MLIGPVIIAVVIVLILPVVFLVSGAVIAAITGHFLTTYAEQEHEGSELIDLNT